MSKKIIKRLFRECFPDSSFLRKLFTEGQIFMLKRYLLSEREITEGEQSFAEKQKIVEKYRKKWKHYVRGKENTARRMLSEAPCYQNRNDRDEIFTDMIFCYLAYGFHPSEYCYFGLVDKSPDERREFVSEHYKKCFKFAANEFDDLTFTNKYLEYECFKAFYKRDAIRIINKNDYTSFLKFLDKHPMFVKKLVDESCGKSVELVDSTHSATNKEQLFANILSQGETILEERVVQTPQMASFNESSLNTVRCFSFYTRDGVIVPFGFLRTGREGSFVDNAGSGGIFAALDTRSGKIIADGCDEMGNHYKTHPESGVEYIGFQIPDWDQAIALCTEAASTVPRNKYIGWDLAHTANGWLIIEGNTSGQLVEQGSLQRGIKPELDRIIKNMDLITKMI